MRSDVNGADAMCCVCSIGASQQEESSKGDGSLQIMYGLHGEHKLEELELNHLSGYMNSKPVRIGNGAYDQVSGNKHKAR